MLGKLAAGPLTRITAAMSPGYCGFLRARLASYWDQQGTGCAELRKTHENAQPLNSKGPWCFVSHTQQGYGQDRMLCLLFSPVFLCAV